MTFDPNDSRITAFVFGELSDDQAQAFRAEMASSAKLREAVEETRKTLDLLKADLGGEPAISLTAAQREVVDRQIDDGAKAGSQWQPRTLGRFNMTPFLTIAASVLVLGGLSLVAYTMSRTNRAQTARLMEDAVPHGYRAAVEVDHSGEDRDAEQKPPTVKRYNGQSELTAVDTPVAETKAPTDAKPVLEVEEMEALVAKNEQLAKRIDEYSTANRQESKAIKDSLATIGRAKRRQVGREFGELQQAERLYEGLAREQVRLKEISKEIAPVAVDEHVTKLYRSLNGEARELEELRQDKGIGPGFSGDKHEPINDNPFKDVMVAPLSTFSIDVDTAAYSKVRMYLMQNKTLPRPDAVRIEELVNYFTYDYAPPTDDKPFASHIEIADCPWNGQHRLVRVGIKGREIEQKDRPTSNLVFLLDVSGSMDRANKLPLLKRGMKMLVDQLGENDRVAIVVYAGAAGLVLDSTTGDQKQLILDALDRLKAGGSTNGGEGIRLAYQMALDHFIKGGTNRVILCTDGDFNVGTTGTDELVRLAEENAKTGVFLSVLGFGMGNHNDAMLERVSNKGNGNYAFIDTDAEARKVLVEQMSGTLVTIAKDVKIQVEFNPSQVALYRLIGYENRILAAEDFNDDTKDAGEIGAGHTVTALYEIVPADADSDVQVPPVDDLRYQKSARLTKEADSGEMMTLKIRYKQPDEDVSTKLEFPVEDEGKKFGQASKDFRFASAVASFGMLLRNSPYKGTATMAGVAEIAKEAAENDKSGYRDEFLKMVNRADELIGE